MSSNAMLNTLLTVAAVAVVRGDAVTDIGGGEEAGDDDVLGGVVWVGVELRRVGDVECVLIDGQGQAKSRNREEQVEHHPGSSPEDL